MTALDRCPDTLPSQRRPGNELGQCILRIGHTGPHDGGRDHALALQQEAADYPLFADGTLAVQVWPSYVGACEQHPLLVAFCEPDSVDYQRGQIQWGPAGDDLPRELQGQIVGRAIIHVPAGEYTHLAYFYGPEGPCMAGPGFALPHPFRFAAAGVLEVYPISNPHAAMATQAG